MNWGFSEMSLPAPWLGEGTHGRSLQNVLTDNVTLNSAYLGMSQRAVVSAQETFAKQVLVDFKTVRLCYFHYLEYSSPFLAFHQSLQPLGILTESIKT